MRYLSKSTVAIALSCTLVWVFTGSTTAFAQRGGGGNGEKGNRSGGFSMRGGGGMSGGNAGNGNHGGSMRGSRSGGGSQFGNSGSDGREGMHSRNSGGATQGDRSSGNNQGRSSGGNWTRGMSGGNAGGSMSGSTNHDGWSGSGRNGGSHNGTYGGGTWGGHDSHGGHDERNHGYSGGGHYGGKHYRNHGGHNSSFNHFYFGPSGIGYGYYDDGWGISIGLPLGGYYDSNHYGQPYYGGSYVQPYYTEYIQPVETVYPESTATVPGVDSVGGVGSYQFQAVQALRENRHEDAARLINHALVDNPENGKLHLIASQIMFALGDYPAASQAIHQAASLLDRSEWGYVVENYTDYYRGDAYVVQMKALSKFIKENPDAAYAWFLRGYHYNYLGYDEDAQKQLMRAIELESRDRLAGELLIMAGGELPKQPEPAPPTPLDNSSPPAHNPANSK